MGNNSYSGKFQEGKAIFLDTHDISNWNDSNKYIYMYMFNDNTDHNWVKMERCYKDDNNYFSGIVPKSGYDKLIFTLQNEDVGNWNNNIKQTVNIEYSEGKNCFTLSIEDNGTWNSSTFDKKRVFTGDVFFVDIDPSNNDSPNGLIKWTNRIGGGNNTKYWYTLYLPSYMNVQNNGYGHYTLPVYFGHGETICINGHKIENGSEYELEVGRIYQVNGYELHVVQSNLLLYILIRKMTCL